MNYKKTTIPAFCQKVSRKKGKRRHVSASTITPSRMQPTSQNKKQNDFIQRCMNNNTTKKEFPKANQRRAICQTQWNNKK